jgi:trafficking protein particle complex subunit 13
MSRQQSPTRPPGSTGSGVGGGGGEDSSSSSSTAVPTLRVMRLQSPELHTPTAGCLDSQPLLNNALCLPDSLGVFVGETFTAYLGVLNVSLHNTIRRLVVTAQLQTPSQRRQLTSVLEASGGVDVPPAASVDAIVSHAIEEAGQHILRVEVGYMTGDGAGNKTFRKFYRFQVVNPLQISELTVRGGDSCCYVSLSVQYNPTEQAAASPSNVAASATAASNSVVGGGLVISEADFLPATGFSATRIGRTSPFKNDDNDDLALLSATQLLDACGYLTPGSVTRYLFEVKATSKEALLRGIAAGDLLGKAIFTWRKSMGETGRIASSNISCPAVAIPKSLSFNTSSSSFVVHRSGLSVDVAAAAASRGQQQQLGGGVMPLLGGNLLQHQQNRHPYQQLPVTVEPIDPPSTLQLNVPTEVQFLVVNHSEQEMTLQLQFRLAEMATAAGTTTIGPNDDDDDDDHDDSKEKGGGIGGGLLAVCGPSFVSLGQVAAAGGSTVVPISFLPLAAGLLTAKGCWVVDLASDWEIAQPGLFHVHVHAAGSLDKDSSTSSAKQ